MNKAKDKAEAVAILSFQKAGWKPRTSPQYGGLEKGEPDLFCISPTGKGLAVEVKNGSANEGNLRFYTRLWKPDQRIWAANHPRIWRMFLCLGKDYTGREIAAWLMPYWFWNSAITECSKSIHYDWLIKSAKDHLLQPQVSISGFFFQIPEKEGYYGD
ncbi:MAG: hypothetical protein HC892_00100 [Saprospiraceae bacterium]|nr:hypothetical protein [Saprospiraceae bacterium]